MLIMVYPFFLNQWFGSNKPNFYIKILIFDLGQSQFRLNIRDGSKVDL
jgi:hypothetical protein